MPYVITFIYGIIRNIVLTYEPDSADEFAVLDQVFGYVCP